MQWTATREELHADFELMVAGHRAFSAHFDAVAEGEAWLQAMGQLGAAIEAGDQEAAAEMRRLTDALEQALAFKAGAAASSARVAFHDKDQEPVKILIPTPRMMWQLMAGGFTRRKRVVGACPDTGLPIMEGSAEVMGPMTHDEAIAFLIWKDLPPGCNHYAVISTDDLPRIDGCPIKGRAFRAAWRLEEAA